MKKIILLIFLTSCSFQVKKSTLDVQYLKIDSLSLGEYKYLLGNGFVKKNIIK